jgi:sec-independent protein translocase protein TatC
MEKEKIFHILNGLKRFVLKALVVVTVAGIVCFIYFKELLHLLLQTVGMQVYYFTFPEVFFSSVELAIYGGVFFSLPFVILLLWDEFKGSMGLKPLEGCLFVAFSIILFYAGSMFCYGIVLKSGIKFLLGYEGNALKAMISVEKFIKFSVAMIFAFGVTFEVPIILLALNKMGIVKVKTLTRTRRYAILLITIAAALITPTPDVYNMMLLAVPTYVLYEVGILLMKMSERKSKNVY